MIYFIILPYLALLALYYDFGRAKGGRLLNYLLVFVILVCLAGFRYKVGGDTHRYMLVHDVMPPLNDLFEVDLGLEKLQPLWLLLSSIAKTVDKEFYVLQLMHALIVNSIIFLFIKSNTKYIFTAILLYCIAVYPFFNFEILRESLAVCMFLLSIKYYKENRWAGYYFYVSLAFLFHFSAFFLFFLPLVRHAKYKIFLISFVFIVSIFANSTIPFLLQSTSGLPSIFSSAFVYAEYNYSIFGLASLFVLYVAYPAVVFYVSRHMNIDSPVLRNLVVTAIWIGAVTPLYFILYRLLNYFTIIVIILVSEVINNISRLKAPSALKAFSVLILFVSLFSIYTFSYFGDTSALAKGTRWYSRWYPYYSIFDKVTDVDRERLIGAEFSK